MTEPRKLKGSFRIGCQRGNQFRPIATVALSRDGGVMIAPADVPGQSWRYAISRGADFSDPIEISVSDHRPKVHYHRSGIASVTLTGHDLERRSMRLLPIDRTARGQILSVVCVRPWQLPVRAMRKGDVATIHDRWPGDLTFMFQLLRYATPLPAVDEAQDVIGPLRLLHFDDSRFAIDMTAYMPETLLIGLTAYHAEPSDFHQPGITVAALPWSESRTEADQRGVLALWSSSLRNPLVAHARPEDVLTEDELASRIGAGAFRIEDIDTITERLFETGATYRGSATDCGSA